MKNKFVPDDYMKLAESDKMMVYEVKYDDRLIEFICNRYNIKLCLIIDKHHIDGDYMCMCYYDGLDIDDYTHNSLNNFKVITFRDKNNHLNTPHVDFLNKYDSFQMNVDECIESFKMRVVDAISKGFNILTILGKKDDFGVLPYGSSENEIMMKLQVIGLI